MLLNFYLMNIIDCDININYAYLLLGYNLILIDEQK